MKTSDHPRQFRKGQVFTTDAMLAVLLVLIFSGMAISFSIEESALRSELTKERFAEDALITLDLTGAFAAGNATLINSTISQLAPPNLNWSLNITTYLVNGSSLLPYGSARYGYTAGPDSDVFVSQRRFASYSQGIIANVSVARLEVW